MSTQIKNLKSGLSFMVCFAMAVFMLSGCAIDMSNVEHGYTGVPSVSTEKNIYAPGEDIIINFSNAPGNKYDWIAVYNDGVKPGSGIFTRLFLFTDGTNPGGTSGITRGTLVFDKDSDNPENTTVDWPLAEGEYDIYLFCCDDYGVLAGPAEFKVVAGGSD